MGLDEQATKAEQRLRNTPEDELGPAAKTLLGVFPRMEINCPNCDDGNYTCRVTGGSFDGAHESSYACDGCAEVRLADVRSRFPNAEVHPLRAKRA